MKKLLYLAMAALMVLAVSCKKDPASKTPPFKEKDLIGYWACTQSITNDESPEIYPAQALLMKEDHNGGLSWRGDNYFFTWALEGDDLKLLGEHVPDVSTLKKLDGRHMIWFQKFETTSISYLDSYTNISAILPGKWDITFDDGEDQQSYIVTIDKSGSSSWVSHEVDAGTYNWELLVKDSRVTIHFKGNGWEDYLIIHEIGSDDHLVARNNLYSSVTLERKQ